MYKNKILSIALIVAIALSIVTVGKAFSGTAQNVFENATVYFGGGEGMTLGGATNFDYVDTENGYYVNGSQIINSVGAFIGSVTGVITGTTATLTGATATGKLTQGGGIFATTTTANAGTLTAAQMAAYNVIDFTPLGAAATLTLPATSTMTTLLPNAGDMGTWVIRNGASAATTTTIAAGAGIDLQEPDGQNVVISQNNFAWLTCYRKADTDVVCLVDESIVAD